MLIPRSRQYPFKSFVHRDKFPVTYQLCTATRVKLNQLCTWTAKTRAIPSLHRDSFLAKVPGLCPVLASGNTTSLYCRAVSCKANYVQVLIIPVLPTHKQEFCSPSLQPSLRCKTHASLPTRTPPS